jgi:hypothetical protein
MKSGLALTLVCHVSTLCLATPLMIACRRHGQPMPTTAAPAPAVAAPPAEAQSGRPIIAFDARVHDFGLVNEGDTLRHVFQVRNQGTAPLILSEVTTSCGCTAATLGATTIPPGGAGPLEVTMDTHGEQGEGTRSITVLSNDPRQPTSTLEIKYEVERLLGFDRWFVQLTTTRGSRRVERVWLTGRLAERAKLRIEVDGPKIVTARALQVRDGRRLRTGLELRLHARAPASGDGVVTIHTGLPSPPELSLPFRYQVD